MCHAGSSVDFRSGKMSSLLMENILLWDIGNSGKMYQITTNAGVS